MPADPGERWVRGWAGSATPGQSLGEGLRGATGSIPSSTRLLGSVPGSTTDPVHSPYPRHGREALPTHGSTSIVLGSMCPLFPPPHQARFGSSHVCVTSCACVFTAFLGTRCFSTHWSVAPHACLLPPPWPGGSWSAGDRALGLCWEPARRAKQQHIPKPSLCRCCPHLPTVAPGYCSSACTILPSTDPFLSFPPRPGGFTDATKKKVLDVLGFQNIHLEKSTW